MAAGVAILSACGTAPLAVSPASPGPTGTARATPTARASASARPSVAPTVSALPTRTPAPTGISAEAASAVVHKVFVDGPDGIGECDKGDDLTACPVTDRLKARLLQHPTSDAGGGAAPFCRCQNTSPTLSISASSSAGTKTVAHVALFSGVVKIDLVIVQSGAEVLVDDTSCTGKDPVATSIYAAVVGPCDN